MTVSTRDISEEWRQQAFAGGRWVCENNVIEIQGQTTVQKKLNHALESPEVERNQSKTLGNRVLSFQPC